MSNGQSKHNIAYIVKIATVEHKSYCNLIKDTPYLTLKGEL